MTIIHDRAPLNDIGVMEDDYVLDVKEAKKLAKWNLILGDVEQWIRDWTMSSMHPPRREDCEKDLSHIKPKHIKKAWKKLV